MKLRFAVAITPLALLASISALAQPPFDTTPPAQCTNLAIDGIGPHTCVLTWTNSGDDGMTGQATAYQVRYSTSPIDDSNWNSAQVFCSGTPGSGGTSACCDGGSITLSRDSRYYFAIKFWDEVDNESPVSNCPYGTTPHSGPEVAC